MKMDKFNRLAACSILSCFLMGCRDGGDVRFPEPDVDPAEIASRIMAAYDSNSDGELSKAELQKCRGLEMLTAGQEQMMPDYRLDKDGSGTITETEFAAKLAECLEDRRQGYHCVVIYRGQPLAGAKVTLVPEPFMGSVPTASGETDANGNCSVSTDDGIEGAVPGIYRVEITHPTTEIPSRYNSESTFSIALDPTNPYAMQGVPRFHVK